MCVCVCVCREGERLLGGNTKKHKVQDETDRQRTDITALQRSTKYRVRQRTDITALQRSAKYRARRTDKGRTLHRYKAAQSTG